MGFLRQPTSVGFSLLRAFRAVLRVLTFFSLIPFSLLSIPAFSSSTSSLPNHFRTHFSLLSTFLFSLSLLVFSFTSSLPNHFSLSPFHSCLASSSLGIDGRWGCPWATAGVKARATDAKVVDSGRPQEAHIHGLWIRVSPSKGADLPPSVPGGVITTRVDSSGDGGFNH